jgi:hypothetical protein
LRSQEHFGWYRGHQVPFSCFALPDSIWAVLSASGPVLIFFPPALIFGCTESAGSHCNVLRIRTRFRRYRGRRVPFSCFAFSDSFSVIPRASGPVFMFCAPELVFGGTEGAMSYFHVLRSQVRVRRNRGPRVPFSCFVLPNSFSTVPRAPGPIIIFCTPRLICGGTKGIECYFHVLRSRTHFRRYRGRRVPFLCFAHPDSFLTVPSASSPVFKFYAPGLLFYDIEGVKSYFHVLCSRTHFRQYRGCRVPFSCFELSGSFWAVQRLPGPVFMFCAPGLIFGGTECVVSRFNVLPSRTHFRRYREHRVPL